MAPNTRALIARGLLVVGPLLAIFLWMASERTAVETRYIQGHARVAYDVVEKSIYFAPRVLSAAVLGLGLVGWAALSRARLPLRAGGALLGIIGAALIAVSAFASTEDPSFEAFEHYDSPREVAAAMAEDGIPCARLQARPVDRSGYFTALASCPVRADLAIDDGFDDATIRMWKDADARLDWQEVTAVEDVSAVVGPTWLVVCEFRSTCAEIQHGIGGRMH